MRRKRVPVLKDIFMKILNLYAGIGGNRVYWTGHDITAVEINPYIAEVYKQRFPNDNVVVSDSLSYLEARFREFDYIWASPPCQSHGQYRHNVGVLGKGFSPVLPDMSLYSIVVFLRTYSRGKWSVENTIPYYEYLIPPTIVLQRHPIWANFPIPCKLFPGDKIRTRNKITDFQEAELLRNSPIANKRQVLRNQCSPEIGLYVLEQAIK